MDLSPGPVRFVEMRAREAAVLWQDIMDLRHVFSGEVRRTLERLLTPLTILKEGLGRTVTSRGP